MLKEDARRSAVATDPRGLFLDDALRWLTPLLAVVTLSFANGRHLVPALAWIAPALLLASLRRRSSKVATAVALGVMAVVSAVQWTGVVPLPAPWSALAAAALGPVLAIPYLLDRLVGASLSPSLRLWIFPCAQVALEWLIYVVSPFASFGALAYTQVDFPTVTQVASLGGLWAVSFVVALAGSTGAALLTTGGRRDLRLAAPFALVLGGALAFGALRLAGAGSGPTLRVAGLAAKPADLTVIAATRGGCGADGCAAARTDARAKFNAMVARTQEAARRGAQVVVWSEVAGTVFADEQPAALAALSALARRERITLAAALWIVQPGVRLWENKVLLFGPDGRRLASYLKSHPVPGDLDIIGSGVPPVVPTSLGRLGLAICYDMDFPALSRGAADADVMLVPGSDWAAIDPLHPRMVALRAVENGFAVVRPSRQSLSVAFDAYGRQLAQVPWNGSATPTLAALVPLLSSRTIYSRVGDVLPLFAIIALTMLAATSARPQLGRRRELAGISH